MSQEDKFIKAFDNYINVLLKNSWGFKETYQISLIDDGVLLKSLSTKKTQLTNILEIDKYKKLFIKTTLPGISKIFSDAKTYGITVYLCKYAQIEILVKKQLYLDLVPNELLYEILVYLYEIESFVLISNNNNDKIYNELIKTLDLQLTGGKIYKWINPHNTNFTYIDYIHFKDEFLNINTRIIRYNDLNKYIGFNRNISKPQEGKRLLDFILNTNENFNKINGYPLFHIIDQSLIHIISDNYGWLSMIKMRQFYPYFIGIRHEKEFSRDAYYLKGKIENKRYPDNMDILILKYIETGKLEEELDIRDNMDYLEYILNNLLYDENFKFKSFNEYVSVLKYITDKSSLIKEYKDTISQENINKLIEYARKNKDYKVVQILHELLIDERELITNYVGSFNKINTLVDLPDL